MDVAEVAEQLYAAAPEDFTAKRTAEAAAAKKSGDKELAKQIGGLRKPTRAAWLVNLLARSAADDVSGLLDLGAALREAQENLDAADLRTLSRQRNQVVDQLSRQAVALGADADYQATEAVRQEVAQTLQAALADPDTADLVRRGVLAQAVSYGGFGTFDLAAAAGPTRSSPAKRSPSGAASEDTDAAGTADDAEAAERAEAEQAARRKLWELAKDALGKAEEDAEQARAEIDTRAEQTAELRRRLAEAEEAENQARDTADAAARRVEELAAAEREARPDR